MLKRTQNATSPSKFLKLRMKLFWKYPDIPRHSLRRGSRPENDCRTSVSGAVNEGRENNISFLLKNSFSKSMGSLRLTRTRDVINFLSQNSWVCGWVRSEDQNDLLRLGDMPLLIAPTLNCWRGPSPVHWQNSASSPEERGRNNPDWMFISSRVVLSLRISFSSRRKSVQVVLLSRGTLSMDEKEEKSKIFLMDCGNWRSSITSSLNVVFFLSALHM